MDKKQLSIFLFFLSATFPRWKHLLSTFTVNDRSITRSSFEINVLILPRDAMTSDAVIDRRISVTLSLANQRPVFGLTDQWEEACHKLVTCCDGSDHWHVVCHALRVDKSSMWRHLQTPHLSFFFLQIFFACSWFLLLISWPTDRNAKLVPLISLIFWAEAFKHFNNLFKGGYRVR